MILPELFAEAAISPLAFPANSPILKIFSK
jgi:hypothetical protein